MSGPKAKPPKVADILLTLSEQITKILAEAEADKSFGALEITGLVQEGNLQRLEVGFKKSLVFRAGSR